MRARSYFLFINALIKDAIGVEVFFAIFISNIFASEIVENNFDEANKIIDKKIKEYNPSEKNNIKFSEDELDILCGKAHFSSACETLIFSIDNDVIKKRISFILRKETIQHVIMTNLIFQLEQIRLKLFLVRKLLQDQLI